MQNVPWFNHPMRVNSAMFRPWLSTLNAEMLHGLPNDQVIWSEPTFGRQRLELSQEQHPEMTTFEHAACWGSGFLHPKMMKMVEICWKMLECIRRSNHLFRIAFGVSKRPMGRHMRKSSAPVLSNQSKARNHGTCKPAEIWLCTCFCAETWTMSGNLRNKASKISWFLAISSDLAKGGTAIARLCSWKREQCDIVSKVLDEQNPEKSAPAEISLSNISVQYGTFM